MESEINSSTALSQKGDPVDNLKIYSIKKVSYYQILRLYFKFVIHFYGRLDQEQTVLLTFKLILDIN